MFDYFKKIAISNRADDELLYEFVLNEIENGVVSKGLWGKALANSSGNDANAKSIYMQYRVQSIKDVFTAQKIAYKELSKPKLFQHIQEKIFPITNDYTDLVPKAEVIDSENYLVSEEEEGLYEEVATELSNNIRKEGLWLKAIQNTDGDENRALALYIKYRSEAIKVEKQEIMNKQQEILDKQKKLEQNRINAHKYHNKGGFNKLFEKELEIKGYKVIDNTTLSMRIGFFETEQYKTTIDTEKSLFLIINKQGLTVDSFKYKF